ncbi:hypothetical protein DFH06DRAFT_1321830 [Mycena polygramma]|nr:hypothetical protein DFH06DRAFT_1321830 [Mycena polygramma]
MSLQPSQLLKLNIELHDGEDTTIRTISTKAGKNLSELLADIMGEGLYGDRLTEEADPRLHLASTIHLLTLLLSQNQPAQGLRTLIGKSKSQEREPPEEDEEEEETGARRLRSHGKSDKKQAKVGKPAAPKRKRSRAKSGKKSAKKSKGGSGSESGSESEPEDQPPKKVVKLASNTNVRPKKGRVPQLTETTRLTTLFSSPPRTDEVHLIVSTKEARKASSEMLTEAQMPVRLTDVLIVRHELASNLYNAALQHSSFLVQGPPGSGKSLLAYQLKAYIQEQEPDARVTITTTWRTQPEERASPNSIICSAVDTLQNNLNRSKEAGDTVDLSFQGPGKHWVLLDEAQSTYADQDVHNTMLKTYQRHFVFVFFASHGSVQNVQLSTNPADVVANTPIVFDPTRRMGLRPTMNGVGGRPILGLYFTRDEYATLLKHQADLTPKLAPDLQDYIFELSGGHVGVIKSLMGVVTSQSKANGHQGMSLPTFLATFDNPADALRYSCSGDAVLRGLPSKPTIQHAANGAIVKYCKKLLIQNGPFIYPVGEVPEVAHQAHKLGWLITEAEDPEENRVRVDFPSPLHRARLGYLLMGEEVPPLDVLKLTLREFLLQVIPCFSGNALLRANPGELSVPEAQYHNEFYRACSERTGGRGMWLLPEFGNSEGKRGRIDFFMGSVGWGIEFLREGDRMDHLARFGQDGVYHVWTKNHAIKEWVVLDCRMQSTPTEPSPDEPNLLHVLFEQSDTGLRYRILDNELKPVGPPEGGPLVGDVH